METKSSKHYKQYIDSFFGDDFLKKYFHEKAKMLKDKNEKNDSNSDSI